MDNPPERRRDRVKRWLKTKLEGADPYPFDSDLHQDEDEDAGNDSSFQENFFKAMEMGNCIRNELRIFVGTWNVAGRDPVGSLAVDLDDWLNLKDAADIYVLGFQEIVPLKAMTVLGTEDPTPAGRWNSLIGTTLNNKYGRPWLTPLTNPTVDPMYNDTSLGSKMHSSSLQQDYFRRISTEAEELSGRHYALIASKKMVGVFISIWIKKELLKRYYISSVKVCSVGCGIMGYLGNKGSVAVSMCIQGTSFCFVVAHLASGEKKGDEMRRNYQVLDIFRRTTFPRTTHLDKSSTSQLPQTIFGHDRIFWFGDLNYRLYLEDSSARQLIRKEDWKALKEYDQLKKEQDDDGVFQGWREGDIEFAPTYKYSTLNCNRYSGGLPSRTGEKQRTPAWCDRILWYGKGVTQLSYVRSESKFSDHRPVSALFSMHIDMPKEETSNTTLLSLLVKDIEESSIHCT